METYRLIDKNIQVSATTKIITINHQVCIFLERKYQTSKNFVRLLVTNNTNVNVCYWKYNHLKPSIHNVDKLLFHCHNLHHVKTIVPCFFLCFIPYKKCIFVKIKQAVRLANSGGWNPLAIETSCQFIVYVS